MSNAIVQINFDLTVPAAELEKHATQIADRFNQVDGLLWKIWIVNEAQQVTGGIYLFENISKAQNYVDSDIVADLRRNWTNVEVKVFEVMEAPSRITRAPLNHQ